MSEIKVYLIYADQDPNANIYLQAIKETSIHPLKCCNNEIKNLLRNNTYHLRIDHLPVFICCQGHHRWQLNWSQLELVKRLNLK